MEVSPPRPRRGLKTPLSGLWHTQSSNWWQTYKVSVGDKLDVEKFVVAARRHPLPSIKSSPPVKAPTSASVPPPLPEPASAPRCSSSTRQTRPPPSSSASARASTRPAAIASHRWSRSPPSTPDSPFKPHPPHSSVHERSRQRQNGPRLQQQASRREKFGGEAVIAGNIILRQRGTWAGSPAATSAMARSHTIFALGGRQRPLRQRSAVNVDPVALRRNRFRLPTSRKGVITSTPFLSPRVPRSAFSFQSQHFISVRNRTASPPDSPLFLLPAPVPSRRNRDAIFRISSRPVPEARRDPGHSQPPRALQRGSVTHRNAWKPTPNHQASPTSGTGIAKHGIIRLSSKAITDPARRRRRTWMPSHQRTARTPTTSPGARRPHACGHTCTPLQPWPSPAPRQHRDLRSHGDRTIFQPAEEAMPATFKGD